MSEYSGNLCKICLNNNGTSNITNSSKYLNIFNKLFDVSDFTLWLCVWCKSIMRNVKNLLDTAKCINKGPNENETEKVETKNNNLSFHHLPHIDIVPKEIIDLKDIKKENEEEIKPIEIPSKTEANFPEQKTLDTQNLGCLKNLSFDDLVFDVLSLTVDEQKKEIEDKKRSEKFIKDKFKCDLCGISFMFKNDIIEHAKRHDESTGRHACSICHLRFKSSEVLSQHTLAHRRRFQCRICGTKVKRWSLCTAHRQRCGSNDSPAVCGECKKVFNNVHALEIHMKCVHEVKKKYICDDCGKTLHTKQRLIVHIRSHTGFKPYICDVCRRSFATNSNLRAHAKVHSNDKKYYCVECDKHYKSEKSLVRHFVETARHAGGRFLCNDCPKKCTSEKNLQKHISTIHLEEHRCIHCLKVFSNTSNLNKHIRSIHEKTDA